MADKHFERDDFILHLLSIDDEQSMVMLFDLYYELLLGKVTRYIHDRQAAKDIVQEIFINVWCNRHLTAIRKPIKAYLEGSASNRAFNYLRDTRKFRGTNIADSESFSHGDIYRYAADKSMELEELSGRIGLAVDLLPEKLREPFLLSREGGMTHKQIALHLGFSEVVVEKRIMKALKLVRLYLMKYLS